MSKAWKTPELAADAAQSKRKMQIVSKGGKVYAVNKARPYDEETVRNMKRAGYKVREVEDNEK